MILDRIIPIEELDFNGIIDKTLLFYLKKAGINTINDIYSKNNAELAAIRELGSARYELLFEKMVQHGFPVEQFDLDEVITK